MGGAGEKSQGNFSKQKIQIAEKTQSIKLPRDIGDKKPENKNKGSS